MGKKMIREDDLIELCELSSKSSHAHASTVLMAIESVKDSDEKGEMIDFFEVCAPLRDEPDVARVLEKIDESIDWSVRLPRFQLAVVLVPDDEKALLKKSITESLRNHSK